MMKRIGYSPGTHVIDWFFDDTGGINEARSRIGVVGGVK